MGFGKRVFGRRNRKTPAKLQQAKSSILLCSLCGEQKAKSKYVLTTSSRGRYFPNIGSTSGCAVAFCENHFYVEGKSVASPAILRGVADCVSALVEYIDGHAESDTERPHSLVKSRLQHAKTPGYGFICDEWTDCNCTFPTLLKLQKHKKRNQPPQLEKRNTLHGELHRCGFSCGSRFTLTQHQKTQHSRASRKTRHAPTQARPKPYYRKRPKPESQHCELSGCSFSCGNRSILSFHYQTQHGVKSGKKCVPTTWLHCEFPGCSFSFTKRGFLTRHYRLRHGIISDKTGSDLTRASVIVSDSELVKEEPSENNTLSNYSNETESCSSLDKTQFRGKISYPCRFPGCDYASGSAYDLNEHKMIHFQFIHPLNENGDELNPCDTNILRNAAPAQSPDAAQKMIDYVDEPRRYLGASALIREHDQIIRTISAVILANDGGAGISASEIASSIIANFDTSHIDKLGLYCVINDAVTDMLTRNIIEQRYTTIGRSFSLVQSNSVPQLPTTSIVKDEPSDGSVSELTLGDILHGNPALTGNSISARFRNEVVTDDLVGQEAVKIIPCQFCVKRFERTVSLRRHILTHTGEKRHNCDYCSYTAFSACNVARHKRRRHTAVVDVPK